MKRYLGEFEELVLLTIVCLGEDAYGVSIKEDIEERARRSVSIGSLHSTISRLEDKGYVTSWMGEPSKERGGRRKRYFKITGTGEEALVAVKSLRDELWSVANFKLSLE